MSLESVKQALLASYEAHGGINHFDGNNLPSEESVDRLASDLMHLLFPGYFEQNPVTRRSVAGLTERRLQEIATRMATEIEKSLRFARDPQPAKRAKELTMEVLGRLPEIRQIIQTDVTAAFHGDPAARSVEEIILAYPCVLVISLQRIAHVMYRLGVPLLPRMLTEYAHERTGADIHPGAQIGTHFFIDHCTGVVIGETARIGDHVKIYQGVTLGAKSFEIDAEGNPGQGREAPSGRRGARDDLRPRHDPRRRHPHRRPLHRRRQRLAAALDSAPQHRLQQGREPGGAGAPQEGGGHGHDQRSEGRGRLGDLNPAPDAAWNPNVRSWRAARPRARSRAKNGPR